MTNSDINLNRLYWHSRRGMRELDIILIPFLQSEFEQLNQADKNLYVKLLSEEDQDIFAWLVKKESILAGEYKQLIDKMIEFAKTIDERPN